ncbi:Nitroreductase [Abditibacterium utsteinense]|uniref:Nitroreductase n=1 Tax=Abditibacterium utsteinense TaxID=1960156 RepID=A0A2S8SWY6_9BACT|nr:NAD(P)H-dependent oxidoreductase [Abditibacterium utsteinense]PQV65305.1 Nitroreductase [Abditibacterium utsteinense]
MSKSLHPLLDSSAVLDALQSRYATKIFDTERKIDDSTWQTLEETLVLSPSSFGLQPWKFVVITDQKLKEQLLPHSWNQPSITNSSHLVVFFAKNSISEADVSHLIETTAAIRGAESTSLAGYAAMINGTISQRSPEEILDWNKRQVYIALGQFLVAAALLGVDACPMEGFSGPDYDEILGVEGYTATVIATAGYRSADDKYGDLPKVRYDTSELIEHR